ncbi:MAG: hypothetical protein NTX73_09995 [Rhodobacterales bacterium]|nr:hypothetical protein [Rhodobacterales bacterium]
MDDVRPAGDQGQLRATEFGHSFAIAAQHGEAAVFGMDEGAGDRGQRAVLQRERAIEGAHRP